MLVSRDEFDPSAHLAIIPHSVKSLPESKTAVMSVINIFRSCLVMMVTTAVTPVCARAAIVNGDFATGNFAGWTTFDDPNGTANGDPNSGGDPVIALFDVSGNGASSSAQFRVGRTGGPISDQGGGIYQTIQTVTGDLFLSVDVALESTSNNAQGGLFELSVNGLVVDFVDIQSVSVGQIIRDNLTADLSIGAGSQEVRLSVRRRFGAGSAGTPAQYFDNVIATGSAIAVPEPASTVALLLAGMSTGVWRSRRKTRRVQGRQ